MVTFCVVRTILLVIVAAIACAQRVPKPELVQAAEAGDVARVRALLDAGADPNLPKSFSALEAASASAFPEVLKEMLKHHPDVNQRDSAGRTALRVVGASAIGDKRENAAEVVRLLAKAGADVNVQDNFYGNTALHEAPDAATAKALIDAGANINLRNQDGQTALMLTLDENVTRVLLAAGADTTIRDKSGKTALDLARELQLTEKIALLERTR
jgi:ankyrin repeat protein